MNDLAEFVSYIFAAMGLTVLIVWPTDGPMAWVRERILRIGLPQQFRGVLDCYVCLGFWTGALFSLPFWLIFRQAWCCTGCLVVPFLFWWIVVDHRQN